MSNRILRDWVGRGTWQVVSQVLAVVRVVLLGRQVLRLCLNVTYGRVSDSYKGAQRSNKNSKDPNALKHKPMTYNSFLEKFGHWFHIFLRSYEFSKFKSFSKKRKIRILNSEGHMSERDWTWEIRSLIGGTHDR